MTGRLVADRASTVGALDQPQSGSLWIDEPGLCTWFGQACTGDTLVYHCGSLAHDRSPTASRLPPRDQAELARVARRALALAEAGSAALVQRRLGVDRYEYWIIVRPRLRRGSDDWRLVNELAAT
jgi:hypothetical protein